MNPDPVSDAEQEIIAAITRNKSSLLGDAPSSFIFTGKLFVCCNNVFVMAAKNLKDRGEMSIEQYAEILRRAKCS